MIRIASRRVASRIVQRSHVVGAISSLQPPLRDARGERPRTFATDETPLADGVVSASAVEETLEKIFKDQEVSNAVADVIAKATWDPTWYYPSDNAIQAINTIREISGLGYGGSIIVATVGVRFVLFPLFVKVQRNSSRMAHMQPEMQAIKKGVGKNTDHESQLRAGRQMQALFKKYNCNPMSSLLGPLIQIPVFMGMFFGLRIMPDYFGTLMSTEGLFWFSDLTTFDPYYILPVISGVAMFTSVEINKAQMVATNPEHGKLMTNVFRAMTIVMVPAISGFPAALNLYWTVNNTLTAVQAWLFVNPRIRKMLDIWEMPKPVPGMPRPEGMLEAIHNAVKPKLTEEQIIKKHNEGVTMKKKIAVMAKGPVGRSDAKLAKKKFRT